MRRSSCAWAVVIAATGILCADVARGQAAELGVNLPGNSYWETDEIWVNVANTFSPWGTLGSPWISNPSLTFTPDGYPLEPSSVQTWLYDY
ncbi:MAG TPA: hypothetical protein VG722_13050, partial [Tepidisphaeraceae bacterium]|nr:hypothetical protein [Tepidisphaeraceae bacterium]